MTIDYRKQLEKQLHKKAEDRWEWVGVIETYSGISAHILNMENHMIDLVDIATALGNICRYNGHVPNFYSVAEHSCHVAHWLEDQGCDQKTILTGLLHDAAEAYVGDMVRPLKRHPDFGSNHQKIENQITQKICAKYGAHYPYPDIVHDADKAIYIWEIQNIRTGQKRGMHPDDAKELFLSAYEEYSIGVL